MDQIIAPVDNDNLVLLCCPSCGLTKRVSLNKFKDIKHAVTVRCKCNNRFNVQLNFRKTYRKSVAIPGEFMIMPANMMSSWLKMSVCNLSSTGLNFQMVEPVIIHTGDVLRVKFKLDNAKQALIDKKVAVRVVNENSIGCEFTELGFYEKELGFYLRP